MIGDLFGNIGEQQEALKKQLEEIIIEHQSPENEISIQINGSKSILDISIDPDKINLDDHEKLEDLLLITLNKAFEIADQKASEKTQELLNDMLPPGLGSMFGM